MIQQPIQDLLARYADYLKKKDPLEEAPKIHVDEIATKVASFYEKIRSVIDYREEHLLRKNFIDRVFRRRMFLKDINEDVAEPLIKEIIRGGRLPNDYVPESKIKEVEAIIDNSHILIENFKKLRQKNSDEIINWLTTVTISAIEEALFPPIKDEIVAEAMFWTIKKKLAVSGAQIGEEETSLQLFIGIQRALLRVDEAQLQYRLLKFIYPEWNNPAAGNKALIARDLPAVYAAIERHLRHPQRKYFFKLCNHYNTIFYLLGDLVEKHKSPEELKQIFEDENLLEREISANYQKRYDKERSRLNKMAFLSVLSIFLSKVLVALAIEIPIDRYILGEYSVLNTSINIVFPAFLMLIIVLSIKMPTEANEDLVVKEAKKAVYGNGNGGYQLIIPKKPKIFTRLIIRTIYLALFFGMFYALSIALLEIGFSATNIVIFAFFTSLVAAAGIKISNRSKEISLEEKKAKFGGFVMDIFALPFITVGRWGLTALSKLNILVVLFNIVIELPFQLVVLFIENFRSFIKSEKEEIH